MNRLRSLPWLKIGLGLIAAVVVIGVVAPLRRAALNATSQAIFLATTPFAPNVSDFNAKAEGTKILAGDGSTIVVLDGTQQMQPVPLSSLPPHVKNAVLGAEDANFYHHPGVDAGALLRAAIHNAEGGKAQGGSTITQQLAKINYTNRKRSIFRKVKEVLYAAQLERHYTKDQLLERYVNQVYFGEGAYGIAAAAKTYYNTTPDKLSAGAAAMLAGKIRSPEGLNPRTNLPAVQRRRDQVLRNMYKHHFLDKTQLDQALAEPIVLAPPASDRGVAGGSTAPYFVDLVKQEAGTLKELGNDPQSQLFNGGYTVETTLDPKALNAATDSVRKLLNAPGDPSAAVVSVQPGDGAIRNLFGGLDYEHNQFDVATQGVRQPGSSFKPFVYMAALRDGIDPRSEFDSSSPMKIKCGNDTLNIHNFEAVSDRGMINLDTAMAHSVNVVFSQLICKTGPDKVVKVYKDLHFSQPINSDAAIALGGLEKGVSPLEMAAAYATFAAKGVYAQPYTINRILDRNGKVVYQHKVKTEKVFDPNQAGVLTKALEGVVNGGTGTAADFGRPVAGKTGTTENFGNAWFVGYTPQLATAVWVGHVEGDVPMLRVHGGSMQGGRFPAQIFSATMKVALQGQPVLPLFEASPDSLNLHPATPPAQPSDAPKVQTAPPSSTAPTTNPADTTTTSSTELNQNDTTTTTNSFQQQSTTTSSSTTSTTAKRSSTSSSTTTSSTVAPSTTSTTAA